MNELLTAMTIICSSGKDTNLAKTCIANFTRCYDLLQTKNYPDDLFKTMKAMCMEDSEKAISALETNGKSLMGETK